MVRLDRRGLHPLLATILLIGITLAGAAFVYNTFFSQVGAAGKSANIDIVRVNLTKSDVGCLFAITVKNAGNVEISACTVRLQRDDGQVYAWNLGSITPGQVRGTAQWVSGFTLGKNYPVWIDFTTVDGGSFSTSTTVQCLR